MVGSIGVEHETGFLIRVSEEMSDDRRTRGLVESGVANREAWSISPQPPT